MEAGGVFCLRKLCTQDRSKLGKVWGFWFMGSSLDFATSLDGCHVCHGWTTDRLPPPPLTSGTPAAGSGPAAGSPGRC